MGLFREIGYAALLVRALPKTLWFNFHYLPFRQAIRLPVLIGPHTRLAALRGRLIIEQPRFGSIRFGLCRNPMFDLDRPRPVWQVTGGIVRFSGRTDLGASTKFFVESGELNFGRDFSANANFSVSVQTGVSFGDDCLLSWDVTIMDHDFHHITDRQGNKTNPPAPVRIGHHVWIGCDCLLLKGAEIGDHCILAAGSALSKKIEGSYQTLGGNPVRVLKQDTDWRK